MDDLIKFVKEKYIDELIAPIDFHKIIIFLFFLATLNSTQNKNYIGSIWLELGIIDIQNIFDIKSKVWENILIFHILIALSLTAVITPIYSVFKNNFFQKFANIKDLDTYVNKLYLKIKNSLTNNQSLNLILIKDISKDLDIKKKKLIRLHICGEICLSCVVVSIIGLTTKINLIDFAFALAFLSIVIYLQLRAYLYYIKTIIPIALPKKIIMEGKFDADSEY